MADQSVGIPSKSGETKSNLMNDKQSTIDLHEKLHTALTNSDLSEVKKMIDCGVQLCYESAGENCYILAQNKDDPEFLTALLNYNASGVNAINSHGESLLMRDIKYFKSRHAELLIDLGANVNYLNKIEQTTITILHYATMETSTPLNVIKKLLEKKPDVNKKIDVVTMPINFGHDIVEFEMFSAGYSGNTALNCVLKRYDKKTGLDKIKLLVESGADINNTNLEQENPLVEASRLGLENADLDLLKYLISHGAKGVTTDLFRYNCLHNLITVASQIRDLPENERFNWLYNYFIPAFNLLLEAGEDLFSCALTILPLGPRTHKSPLMMSFLNNKFKYGLWNHIAKVTFDKIKNGYQINEDANQIHPFMTIMEYLPNILRDQSLYSDILQMIYENLHTINECLQSNNFTFDLLPDSGPAGMTSIIPIKIKFTLYSAPIWTTHQNRDYNSIIKWYKELKQNNIELCDEDRSSLFSTFIINNVGRSEICANITEMFQYLTDTLKVDMFSSKMRIRDEDKNEIQNLPEIPDIILLAALFSKISLLKEYLPCWNQQPIAVLLCLRPWIEKINYVHKYLLKSIVSILPFLLECGGPLSAGTRIYSLMKEYISEWRSKDLNNMYDPEPLLQCLESHLFESPASLQVLCRTVIRNNAVEYGRNLPNHLASLVPHKTGVLKNFLALTEKYVETEFTWTRAFLDSLIAENRLVPFP